MKSFPPSSADKKLRDELKTDFLNDAAAELPIDLIAPVLTRRSCRCTCGSLPCRSGREVLE